MLSSCCTVQQMQPFRNEDFGCRSTSDSHRTESSRRFQSRVACRRRHCRSGRCWHWCRRRGLHLRYHDLRSSIGSRGLCEMFSIIADHRCHSLDGKRLCPAVRILSMSLMHWIERSSQRGGLLSIWKGTYSQDHQPGCQVLPLPRAAFEKSHARMIDSSPAAVNTGRHAQRNPDL